MEYAARQMNAAPAAAPPPGTSPPPPPDPAADPAAPAVQDILFAAAANNNPDASDEPLRLTSEQWDITSVTAIGALRMLMEAMEALAEATGDVPPTPPVSRPSTPRCEPILSPPSAAGYPAIPIGSPEAHPHEPIVAPVHGAHAQEHTIQHAAIARRFFSKVAPPFSLAEYLLRLHRYCAHSAGVYLAAAAYLERLCVAEVAVPATGRTVHRLALAAIRVASKALEDHRWMQDRVAKVGGVSKLQLMNLEVTLCFLLDFDLWIDNAIIARRMFLLQQAAAGGSHDGGAGGGPRIVAPDGLKLKMPLRKRLAASQAIVAT